MLHVQSFRWSLGPYGPPAGKRVQKKGVVPPGGFKCPENFGLALRVPAAVCMHMRNQIVLHVRNDDGGCRLAHIIYQAHTTCRMIMTNCCSIGRYRIDQVTASHSMHARMHIWRTYVMNYDYDSTRSLTYYSCIVATRARNRK